MFIYEKNDPKPLLHFYICCIDYMWQHFLAFSFTCIVFTTVTHIFSGKYYISSNDLLCSKRTELSKLEENET